jgi:plasmid stability protein
MATLYVREIPDKLYKRAQKIAQTQGRSLSAYVLLALQQAIEDDQRLRNNSKVLARIRRRRRALPPDAPDSVTMTRQLRNRNG